MKEQNFRVKYFCIALGQQNHKFNCCRQCSFLFMMFISVTEIIKTLLPFIQNFHKQSQLRSHSCVCFKAHLEPPYPYFCFPKPTATLPSAHQPTTHSCYCSYLIWGSFFPLLTQLPMAWICFPKLNPDEAVLWDSVQQKVSR